MSHNCFVCQTSLTDEPLRLAPTYSGYDLCLWNINKGEVLSNELDGYLCEECKNAVMKFLDLLKELKK